MTTVNLTEAEIRVCVSLATERWFMKKNSVDRPNYAAGRQQNLLEHDLLAGIRANVSEYAVSKYLGLPWTTPFYENSEHPRRIDHPDVGDHIEVRTLRTRAEVPVWPKDVNKQALIVATHVPNPDTYTQVEILGWMWAVNATKNEWLEPSDGSWRVPVTSLHAISEYSEAF